jgi:hypothetical protein
VVPSSLPSLYWGKCCSRHGRGFPGSRVRSVWHAAMVRLTDDTWSSAASSFWATSRSTSAFTRRTRHRSPRSHSITPGRARARDCSFSTTASHFSSVLVQSWAICGTGSTALEHSSISACSAVSCARQAAISSGVAGGVSAFLACVRGLATPLDSGGSYWHPGPMSPRDTHGRRTDTHGPCP